MKTNRVGFGMLKSKVTQHTKSEISLYKELRRNVFTHIEWEEVKQLMKTQYTVYHEGHKCAILDIAIPQLKIAIRVNGGVHGISWAPLWKDELQKARLEELGWDVIDIFEDERPDLWELVRFK